MARKTNISHPFSLTEALFRLGMIFLTCICVQMGLRAQDIVVVYDPETEVLTIDNQQDVFKLVSSEDMPDALRSFIGDSCKIEKGKKVTVNHVYAEEVKQYGTLIVYLRDANGQYNRPHAIAFRIKNKAVPPAPAKQAPAPERVSSPLFPTYTPVAIAGSAVIALVVLSVVLRLLFKKRKQKKEKMVVEESKKVMQVMCEEKNDCVVGLDYVRNDLDNYYTVSMSTFFKDTTVEKVYLSRGVIKKINSYFKAFLDDPERTRETGCYLIGGWEQIEGARERYNVSIEEMVTPGDDVIPGEYSLNFGLKIGIDLGSTIRNLCEKTNRDYVHTAWMHSHPGLGLFLSTHDLVVQKQLAYPDEPKRLLAIVIDTNTPDWKTAFFVAKNSGEMNNKEDLLQTISFDTLKEWSRHKTVVVTAPSETTPVSNGNTFDISSEDDRDIFSFTSKVINQMDDQMDADTSNEICYFHADIQHVGNKTLRKISACDTLKSDDAHGILALELDDTSDFDAKQYADQLKTFDFCIIYRSDQQSYLLYRHNQQEIRILPISLKEMKEWTRRKRI